MVKNESVDWILHLVHIICDHDVALRLLDDLKEIHISTFYLESLQHCIVGDSHVSDVQLDSATYVAQSMR